jgi:hypothetical protein
MERGLTQQKVGGHLANLGAIQQKAHTLRLGIIPPNQQTLSGCIHAHPMAFQTLVDTLARRHHHRGMCTPYVSHIFLLRMKQL